MADKIEDHPVFGSFFRVEEVIKIDKSRFYPVPRTNSVVIDLKKLPDAILSRDLPLFLRQYIYRNEESKTKNSLREGLIKYIFLVDKKRLTKKDSKKILDSTGIDKELLDKAADNRAIYYEF